MAWRSAAASAWTVVLARARVPEPRVSALHIAAAATSVSAARRLFLRRLRHEPIQYLLGTQPFYSSLLRVRRPVFIPRPETEYMCELLVKRFQGQRIRLLEVGSGSGAIAVTLCKHLDATGIAIDVNPQAVQLTRENAERVLGSDYKRRLEILQQDFYSFAPTERFDLVVSNPPYIPTRSLRSLEKQVRRYESRLALDGGADGQRMVQELLSRDWLRPSGELWLEVDSRYINSLPGEKLLDCFGRMRFLVKTGGH